MVTVQRKDTKWELKRRYREFELMNKELKKFYQNIPALPGKSLFNLTTRD